MTFVPCSLAPTRWTRASGHASQPGPGPDAPGKKMGIRYDPDAPDKSAESLRRERNRNATGLPVPSLAGKAGGNQ